MQQGNRRHRASPIGEGSARFEMQIEDELKEKAAKAAAADHRSLANLIIKLLRDYCEGLAKKQRNKTTK
jgi:predicted HicB family RNase H-like nuclease